MHSSEESAGSRPAPVRAVRRVVELLEAVSGAPDGISLSELGRRTDLSNATALRYLLTLEDYGWIERDRTTGEYLLGLAIPAPSESFARLARIARPSLARLAKTFGENVTLGVLDQTHIALLDRVESYRIIRVASRPEDRDALHSTAIGKAIASTLPDEVVQRLLEASGMPPMTERTITTVHAYLEEIANVRERAFAIADCENDPETRSVAVPLPLPRGHCALSMTGPAMRFSLEDAPSVAAELNAEAQYIVERLRDNGDRPS